MGPGSFSGAHLRPDLKESAPAAADLPDTLQTAPELRQQPMLRWVDLVQRVAKEKEEQDQNCTAPAPQSYDKQPETCRPQPQSCWEWPARHMGWHPQRWAALLLWRTRSLPRPGPLQLSHTELEVRYRLCPRMDRTNSTGALDVQVYACCRSGHLSAGAVSLSSPELSWSVAMGLMETPDTTFPLLSPGGLPLHKVQLTHLVSSEGRRHARNCMPCTSQVSTYTCPYGHPKLRRGPALHTCDMQVGSELAVTLLRYALKQVEVPASAEPDQVVLQGAAAGSKASQHTQVAVARDALHMLDLLALGHAHHWSLDSQLALNLYQAISAAAIMNWVSAPHCHCVRPMSVPGMLSVAPPCAPSDSQVLTDWLEVLHATVTDDTLDWQPTEPELTFMSLMSPQHQWPLQAPHPSCQYPILNGRFPAWVTPGPNTAWVTTGLTKLHAQSSPAPQVAPPCSKILAQSSGESVSEGHRLGSMHSVPDESLSTVSAGAFCRFSPLKTIVMLAGFSNPPAFIIAVLPQVLFLLVYLRPQLESCRASGRGLESVTTRAASYEAYVQVGGIPRSNCGAKHPVQMLNCLGLSSSVQTAASQSTRTAPKAHWGAFHALSGLCCRCRSGS